jgi:predicted metal-dependent phosphoesterase TrpH
MPETDLHLHSCFSDGELTPEELVITAAGLGLDIVSLTDHDTVAGLDRALKAAVEHGIQLIPGVEITVRFLRRDFTGSLHVLVYWNVELLADSDFLKHLGSTVAGGRGPALVRSRVASINREFGPKGRTPLLKRELDEEEVTGLADNISRRHFAMALAKGHGLSREQVSLLIGNQSPAYVPSGIPLERAGEFLGAWPVVPVLAHPAAGSFPGGSHYSEVLPPLEVVEGLLPEFMDAGVKGLEVYYPGHTPEHTRHLINLARENDLVVTGGSDMHDLSQRPMQGPGFVGDVSDFLHLLSRMRGPGSGELP